MKIKLTALSVLTLVLMGCSSPEDKMRGQFLSGCVQSGTDRAFCGCIYDQLEAEFGLEYMKRMNNSGAITQEFMEATFKAGVRCNRL